MTAGPAQCPLTPVAILDLPNTHATSAVKAIYSFFKRDVIAFDKATAAAAAPSGQDTVRLDANVPCRLWEHRRRRPAGLSNARQ